MAKRIPKEEAVVGMMGGCMGGMGVLMMVLMLVFLVGAIGGIVYLARGLGRGGPTPVPALGAGEDRALVALRERYARGEIDRLEYEERRAALTAGGANWP